MVGYIGNYKKELSKTLNGIEPQTLLHDSVFVKIDKASIPYSSVFLQLDCKYWSAEQERALREVMK